MRHIEAHIGNGTVERGNPILVAGQHRLEAARRPGWATIEALVLEGDERDARLWEIAENLHRAELTVQERAEHIAEWVNLVEEKAGQVGQVSGGHGKERGASLASQELNLPRKAVARALQIAGLSNDAKAAAVETGLDDNQSALLKAA